MAKTPSLKTIEKHAAICREAGYEVRGQGVKQVVFRRCGRCGGTGYVWAKHIDNGVCFLCGGSKGRIVSVTSVVRSLSAAKRRDEKRVSDGNARDAVVAERRANADPRIARLIEAAGIEFYENGNVQGSGFAADLVRQWLNHGDLSEKQWPWVEKLAVEAEEKAATPEPVELDVPAERREIEGKILTVKEQDSYYGGTEIKCLVLIESDEGQFKVWGTLPRSLYNAEKGTRVRFTATLEPKEAGFGFFKRPSKAVVIDEVAAE